MPIRLVGCLFVEVRALPPLVVLLCAWLSAAPALAQSEGAYRRVIDDAIAEFDAHHFAEARALFLRAHELQPSARTFRGIGITSFELRDYVTAYRALNDALTDERLPLDDELRASTEALRDRTEHFVGRYRIDVRAPNAEVFVDGEAIDPDDEVLLPIGPHLLVVTAEGFEGWSRTLQVLGREDETLEVSLSAQEPPAIVAPPAVVSTVREPRAGPDHTVGGVSVGVGGALLLASGGFLGAWIWNDEELARCAGATGTVRCTNESTLRAQRDMATGFAIGTGIVGAAVLSFGVAMFVIADGDANHASLLCLASGIGIACRGRF